MFLCLLQENDKNIKRKRNTPTTPKTPCSICSKLSSVFTCRGCGKDFYMSHSIEHRQRLGRQIDELSLNHDQFRQQLLNVISKHQKSFSTALTSIAHELNQARENDDYFERDINDWTQKINQLKEDLRGTDVIDIEKDNSSIILVSKPLVMLSSTEIIEKTAGNIRIEDSGQAVIRNSVDSSHAEARGKGEHSLVLYRKTH